MTTADSKPWKTCYCTVQTTRPIALAAALRRSYLLQHATVYATRPIAATLWCSYPLQKFAL